MTRDEQGLINAETFEDQSPTRRFEAARGVPTLTVLAHPRASRVGERARLTGDAIVALSRVKPTFDGRPLLTPSISRKPLVLARDGERIRVDATATSTPVFIDGVRLVDRGTVTAERLAGGVVIELGKQVALLLHLEHGDGEPAPAFGMVGDSDAIRGVRAAVARHAAAAEPVLIRGETGTGKELVARALHEASPRRDGPFVAVNMAAIPQSLVASELFGFTKGAFSGATEAREGFFARAHGGTLFMDEIGATPGEVQAALLRVLETGEVQSVGSRALRAVDVRVVAASDLDFAQAMRSKRFRPPLYYRLAEREIQVPALRERRADVGRLLVHFVARELTRLGRPELLEPPLEQREVWLPGGLVARLARFDWPGNVRQLRKIALWIAGFAEHDTVPLDSNELERFLHEEGADADAASRRAERPLSEVAARPQARRRLDDIEDDEVLRAMVACKYRLSDAARVLGVSRPSMSVLVDRHPELVRALQLSREEIQNARAQAAEAGEPLWRFLRVSRYGLKRRMGALGLSD